MDKQERTGSQEQRDQFTMVLEDIRSHNRVFGEMLLSVKDKVDSLENRFDGLENKVGEIKIKLDDTFEEVGRLREDVTLMSENKADKSVTAALETRVSKLELAH